MDYISLDLETTGLNPKRDRIIEVGAVKVHGGEVAGEFQSLVNPGRELGEKVCGLTGINDEMLLDAPDIGDIIGPLLKFIGDDILVGHRVLFDYSFVKKAAVNGNFLIFPSSGISAIMT